MNNFQELYLSIHIATIKNLHVYRPNNKANISMHGPFCLMFSFILETLNAGLFLVTHYKNCNAEFTLMQAK